MLALSVAMVRYEGPILYLLSLKSVSLREGVAVAVTWIFAVNVVQVLQLLLLQLVVTVRRIQVG